MDDFKEVKRNATKRKSTIREDTVPKVRIGRKTFSFSAAALHQVLKNGEVKWLKIFYNSKKRQILLCEDKNPKKGSFSVRYFTRMGSRLLVTAQVSSVGFLRTFDLMASIPINGSLQFELVPYADSALTGYMIDLKKEIK
jgi:hypothetical protein